MNKIVSQQNKLSQPIELFYVPADKFNSEGYSQNFVKLFKNALNKAYKSTINKPNSPKYADSKQVKKITIIDDQCSHKAIKRQNGSKRLSVSVNSMEPVKIITQRQRLIKQILTGKSSDQTNKKENISKRCRTLDTKDIDNENYHIDSQNFKYKNHVPKVSFKCRQAFSLNRRRQGQGLPPLLQHLSPNSKRHMTQNLQFIKKYKQIQDEYKKIEHLSSPMSIFSVSPPKKPQSYYFKLDEKLSKITKQSIIRSKTRRLKHSLQDISKHHNFKTLTNPENEAKRKKNLQELMQEDEVLQAIWNEKQLRLKTIENQGELNNKIDEKRPFRNKLTQKEPLDDYFRPWEHSQQTKQQNKFNSSFMFNNSHFLSNRQLSHQQQSP